MRFIAIMICCFAFEASAIRLKNTQPHLARKIEANGRKCLSRLRKRNCRMVNRGEKSNRNIAGTRKRSCHAHALAVDLSLSCGGRAVAGQDPVMWEFADCMRRSGMYTCYANSRVGKAMGGCATSTHRDHIHIGACGGEKGASRVFAYNGGSRGRQIASYVPQPTSSRSQQRYTSRSQVRRPTYTTPRRKVGFFKSFFRKRPRGSSFRRAGY